MCGGGKHTRDYSFGLIDLKHATRRALDGSVTIRVGGIETRGLYVEIADAQNKSSGGKSDPCCMDIKGFLSREAPTSCSELLRSVISFVTAVLFGAPEFVGYVEQLLIEMYRCVEIHGSLIALENINCDMSGGILYEE